MTLLLGYGAHGHDIETIWHRVHGHDAPPAEQLVILDDNPALGMLPDEQGAWKSYHRTIIGVNDPILRRSIASRIVHDAPPLIDPASVRGHHIDIARGCVIAPFAVLLCEVELGRHVHVNYAASMTRCRLGRFVTVGPGATICGDVEVGEGTLIGAGATVSDRVRIGKDCRIGAGAVVPPCSVVPDGTTVIGVWKP